MKSRAIVQNILLFFCLVIVMFFIGEIFIRIMSSAKLIYNIEMVKYAKTLKTEDPLREVSHIHQASKSAKLMGVNIKLNNLGFRGEDVPINKPIGTKRVLVMGSSITLGWGVEYDQVFTTLLEKRLNQENKNSKISKIEVFNAGIGNYNSYYEYRLFLRKFDKVKPDVVVVHYFINDAEPNPIRNENFWLKHSLLVAYLYNRVGLLNFDFNKKFNLFDYYNNNYQENNPDFKRALDSILAMKKICEENDTKFLVVIIPDIHNLKEGTPYKSIYEKIEGFFRRDGINVFNSFNTFQKEYGGREKEIWVQEDDPHPNMKGHKIMADFIYPYLKDNL